MRKAWLLSTALIIPAIALAQTTVERQRNPDFGVVRRAAPGEADVTLTQRAFTDLSRGNPQTIIEKLDRSVQWRATGNREFSEGVTFDSRGATLYLRRMARAIGAGTHQLDVISIEARGDTVVVISAWRRGDTIRRCANLVRFANGNVIAVTESAA